MLASYQYAQNNGYLSDMMYGNGYTYSYVYDDYGRVTGISVNGVQKFTNIYDAKGNIATQTNAYSGLTTEYTYDCSGSLIRAHQPGYSDIRMFMQSDLESQVVYSSGGQNKTFSVTQSSDGLNSTATLISDLTTQKTYDTLNRETAYAIGTMLIRNISYLNVDSNRTTNIPLSVEYKNGDSTLLNTSYTYDELGNILSMTLDGVTYTYTYDGLYQLTTVSTSDNSYTASYAYDGAGNITSKTVNGTTVNYGYDNVWRDKLTSYNGQTIAYDAIGNPTTYLGSTLTWTGRQLNSISKNGTTSSYLYDVDGIRTSKTVGNVTTEYFLSGTTILAEKTGNNVMWYIYDDSGEILGFIYNGNDYYYLKNQQGDVLQIVDNSMNVVGSYAYDAWGKVLSATGAMAQINHIRYRGYYYDTETELYYLNSRYYDPETGRFISPEPNVDTGDFDSGAGLLGYNVYTYCANNPINFYDESGEFILAIIIGVTIGAIVGGAAGYALSRILNVPKDSRWKYILGGAIIGAVIGGCIGYAVGAAGSSGIVLWSGGGMNGAGAHAANFAAKNGLRTLESTMRGKLLTKLNEAAIKVLGKSKGYKFMKPLWDAASRQFVKSAAGKQVYVNVFISASKFSEASIFARIEYEIVRSLGMKIIWHFVK